MKAKKIIIVIPFKDFRDEEYFIPKENFEAKGFKVKTASNELGNAFGADGGEVIVDVKLSEIKLNDFDALVFVGGPGCLKNLNNEESHDLIVKANKFKKIIAAICISPLILAEAGILKNKKSTVWHDNLNKEPIKKIEKFGAIYLNEKVVVDEKIITANGPSAAKEFSENVIKVLNQI